MATNCLTSRRITDASTATRTSHPGRPTVYYDVDALTSHETLYVPSAANAEKDEQLFSRLSTELVGIILAIHRANI